MMKNKFILCGLTGWCLEVFWTGLIALQRRQMKLEGRSSIWMFPIYGLACFICPVYHCIKKHCLFFRGFVYAVFIFIGEYISGIVLKSHAICPWNSCLSP